MNTLLVFVLFAGACMADVSHIVNKQIGIIRSVQDVAPDGHFQYAYETENGISARAEGLPSGEVQGSYKYTDPHGEVVEVTWTAGPEGFNAQGPSIPVVPEHVVRTLAYNAAHPYKEPTTP